jgi:hypothetical protein
MVEQSGAKPDAARRSPQEKKQLSYDKDRRNSYGENDKASRKSIPRNKSRVNRANRHLDRQALLPSTGIRQPETEDGADERLHRRPRKGWRKSADETLRQAVGRRLRRRRMS